MNFGWSDPLKPLRHILRRRHIKAAEGQTAQPLDIFQQVIGGHEELELLIKASVTGGGVGPRVRKSATGRTGPQETTLF